ncbi:MAG: acylneuraminate cytidylyltransferase family protein [Elusimicrobiota bacterium]|nr:acylneuraminate cytidylyltransferase family protein [Elusimicrobiota bacterium]
MTVFAVITARAGSKRLPGKNLRPLGGVPMIGWTIAAAKRAKTLAACWVSTDDPAIAGAARALGGEAPFLRPAALSGDSASSADAARHALAEFEKGGRKADVVVLLQPTTPLRGAGAIDAAVGLVEAGADSAQTVTLDEAHPHHKFRLREGRLIPVNPDAGGDAEAVYRPNGGVYAVRADLLREKGLLRGADHRGVIMDFESSVDIDTLWDFRLAEAIIAETGRRP